MRGDSRGRIAIVGAGPAGMAAGLAAHRVGFDVALYERYPQIKAAGNILNLWPPPQKVLRLLGVDTVDLGAPCHTQFQRCDGKVRADVHLPADVVEEYGGGFIGMLRWGLYKRMLDALPEGMLRLGQRVVGLRDEGARVFLDFEHGITDDVVGAGGYLFIDGPTPIEGVVAHNRTTQASYTPIRHEGRNGYEWWVLEACQPGGPFIEDLLEFARRRAASFTPMMRSLIDATPREHLQRWEIRDRPPRKQWSKGRVTLVGDAAHPTSPYAAYGAGMSIEDGYFLARELSACDVRDTPSVRGALQAFEDRRKPHTARVSQQAFFTGRLFHHTPRWLQPVRDLILDHTPLLQRIIGDATPEHILKQLAEIEDIPHTHQHGG